MVEILLTEVQCTEFTTDSPLNDVEGDVKRHLLHNRTVKIELSTDTKTRLSDSTAILKYFL